MNRDQYLLLKLNEHYIATPGWASDLVSLLKVGVCVMHCLQLQNGLVQVTEIKILVTGDKDLWLFLFQS